VSTPRIEDSFTRHVGNELRRRREFEIRAVWVRLSRLVRPRQSIVCVLDGGTPIGRHEHDRVAPSSK
jgi:hypothetical protein